MNADGTITTPCSVMELVTEGLCTNLFRSTTTIRTSKSLLMKNCHGVLPPDFLAGIENQEVGLRGISRGTALRPDNITLELELTTTNYIYFSQLMWHFTSGRRKFRSTGGRGTPLPYLKSVIVGIFNYCLVCLLYVLFKLFTKAILLRISRALDEAQLVDQRRFWQGFCSMDNIQTVS